MSALLNSFFLFDAGTEPVKISKDAKSSGNSFLKVWRCCSTNGLVGARKSAFEPGNFFCLSIVNISPINVFPIPVGRTTNVLLFFAVSKIDF